MTVPTIHPACIYNEKPLCLLTSSQVVKTQKQSVFQQHELRQPVITCSNLTKETVEGNKYVQSDSTVNFEHVLLTGLLLSAH